ncbi:MAG: hypothetical protein IT158_28785 [Bryobacterales bacterium]|nr:hypothetical protein [Bryobacterales bacterium]
MSSNEPFVFYTERRLVALTGTKAKNLRELTESLRTVPGSCVFYHTHHQYVSHHFERPVFYNDFATWVSEALQERRLGEELAAIDLLSFTSVRQLREAILAVLERYLAGKQGPPRECPPGEEFHFARSQSFIMRTGVVAGSLEDFVDKLSHVSNLSLFYHFFEARLRLERPTNDFSQWLADQGHERLAKAIDRLDPYAMTLDELRDEIVRLTRNYARG